jgi:hypothetical protein
MSKKTSPCFASTTHVIRHLDKNQRSLAPLPVLDKLHAPAMQPAETARNGLDFFCAIAPSCRSRCRYCCCCRCCCCSCCCCCFAEEASKTQKVVPIDWVLSSRCFFALWTKKEVNTRKQAYHQCYPQASLLRANHQKSGPRNGGFHASIRISGTSLLVRDSSSSLYRRCFLKRPAADDGQDRRCCIMMIVLAWRFSKCVAPAFSCDGASRRTDGLLVPSR